MSDIYIIKGIGVLSSGITEWTNVFNVDNLNNLNWSIDTPVTPMPLPEDTHEENILVKMEGNTAKMDLSWTLTDGLNFGTLRRAVDGTFSFINPVDLTVYAQINKFKEEFVPTSIGDKYEVLIVDETGKKLMRDEGTVSNMSFSVSGSSPIVWNVNLAFYVGNVVAMLEADIPPAPTNVLMEVVGGNQIKYTVTAYEGYATEPDGDNAITGTAYKYKKVLNATGVNDTLGSWEEVVTEPSASAPNELIHTFNPIGGAGVYRVKVAQINGNSESANQFYWKYAKTGGTDSSTDITLTG